MQKIAPQPGPRPDGNGLRCSAWLDSSDAPAHGGYMGSPLLLPLAKKLGFTLAALAAARPLPSPPTPALLGRPPSLLPVVPPAPPSLSVELSTMDSCPSPIARLGILFPVPVFSPLFG
ncbi:hypothetical protein DAI22_02g011266 [Oryza sativa Japonica Group]|nr:hypothetical protein DAI22_02g011266 [Oryza sativa Japonica Group]